jgi:hypothetical protein
VPMTASGGIDISKISADDAKRALSELQTRAASELRLIGANASVLHPIFHFTRSDKGHSRGPRTR